MTAPIDGAHRTQLDQVPTWFLPEPPAQLQAALSFRTGLVDQEVLTTDWVPLLLEMALRVNLPAYLEIHTRFTLTTTTIAMAGPPHEVGDWLSRIAARLTHPERADFTACVDDARRRAPQSAPLIEALFWRYGFAGSGASWFGPPLGCWTATFEQLGELATTVFSRSNAVLALDGPPPSTLRLALPDGTGRLAVPHHEPIIPLPASYPRSADGLMLTGIVTRSTAARLATELVGQRATSWLRHGEGISYSPRPGYSAMGAQAILSLDVDVSPGAGQRAVEAVTAVVRELADTGPTSDELGRQQTLARTELADPRVVRTQPFRLAEEELLERPLSSTAKLLQELDQLSPARVADAVAAWRAGGLLGLPPDTDAPAGFPATELEFADPALPSSAASYRQRSETGLTLHRDTMAVRAAQDDLGPTLRLGDAIGYLAWADGRREVFDREGRRIVIEPRLWIDGWALTEDLDRAIDPAMVVQLPARSPERIARCPRLDALDRSIGRTRRALRALLAVAAIVVLWFVGVQLIAVTGPAGREPTPYPWDFLLLGLALTALFLLPTPFLAVRLARLRKHRKAVA